jgi:hypothetical protein
VTVSRPARSDETAVVRSMVILGVNDQLPSQGKPRSGSRIDQCAARGRQTARRGFGLLSARPARRTVFELIGNVRERFSHSVDHSGIDVIEE